MLLLEMPQYLHAGVLSADLVSFPGVSGKELSCSRLVLRICYHRRRWSECKYAARAEVQPRVPNTPDRVPRIRVASDFGGFESYLHQRGGETGHHCLFYGADDDLEAAAYAQLLVLLGLLLQQT